MFLVERDEHGVGGRVPRLEFGQVELRGPAQLIEGIRVPVGQEAHGAGRVAEIEPRHHVRVEVVVHHRRVLVGARHTVDVEGLRSVARVEAEVDPQPGGLDQDLGTLDQRLANSNQQLSSALVTMNRDLSDKIVRLEDRASISMLQRSLRIGYTRAARLIEDMAAEGIVGPSDGTSRPREVFISKIGGDA